MSGIRDFVGQLIDERYLVEELAGSGNVTHVYRGRDQLLDRPVAIKVPRAELRADERDGVRLKQEAQVASAVNSDYVVRYLDAGNFISDGLSTPYLVMEWVEHVPLTEAIVTHDVVPMDIALRWIAELVSALASMHGAGLLHRDLRAANILVRTDGRLVLGDFGSAMFEGGERATIHPARAMARMNASAPEVIEGGEYSTMSDVYAAGVVMYEILAGRSPFPVGDLRTVMKAILSGSVTPLSSLRSSIPSDLMALVTRAMNTEPNTRPADGEALQRELEQALEAGRVEPAVETASKEAIVTVAPVAAEMEQEPEPEPDSRQNELADVEALNAIPVMSHDPMPELYRALRDASPTQKPAGKLSRFLQVARINKSQRGSDMARRVEDILERLNVPFEHRETDATGDDTWTVHADIGKVRVHTDVERGTVSFFQPIHELGVDADDRDEYLLKLLRANFTGVSACFAALSTPDSPDTICVLARLAGANLDTNEVELALETLFRFSALFDS